MCFHEFLNLENMAKNWDWEDKKNKKMAKNLK